tara:strand:- start:833 stop:1348 length:516 start_codon:yes stop_codon:yes gene_type:complete
MENQNSVISSENSKNRINYKQLLKISVNEEHQCVAINVVAKEFRKQKEYEEFYNYVDRLMVKCLKYAKEKFNKDTITILADLSGFLIKHVDYGFFKHAIPYFNDKFPDNMEKVILVNIPVFFKACYNIVSIFIHQETKEKILFEKSKKFKRKFGSSKFTNNLDEIDESDEE